MKIIEHGNLMPRLFTCKCCGCKFVADMKEYQIAINESAFFVSCPECSNKHMKIEEQYAPLYDQKEI